MRVILLLLVILLQVSCNQNSLQKYTIQKGMKGSYGDPERTRVGIIRSDVKDIYTANDSSAYVLAAQWFVEQEDKPDDFNVVRGTKYGRLPLDSELPEEFVESVRRFAFSDGQQSTPVIDSIIRANESNENK